MSADKLGVTTDQLYMFCFRLAREFCLEGNHGDVTDILQEVRQLQLCMLFSGAKLFCPHRSSVCYRTLGRMWLHQEMLQPRIN